MPCRESRRTARPSQLACRLRLFAALAVLGAAGCGGNLGNPDPPQLPNSNEPIGARLLATMLGMKKNEASAAATVEKDRHIFCPEVVVPDGAEASRVYSGAPPSNANLRYQFTLGETARECALEAGQLAIKIGAAGKVLLGPAGTAGSFSVPVRMAVLRKKDNEQVLARLYHATAAIGQSATEADFTVISESLHVPFLQDHAEEDYTIRVEIGEGLAKDEQRQAPSASARRSKMGADRPKQP